MRGAEFLKVVDGLCEFRPQGEYTLTEAVDLITGAIAHCRTRSIAKLLIDALGITGVPVPTLVDRFLMAEEWAQTARGLVVVVVVVEGKYIHPQKFGVRVAADFGLITNVFTRETEARHWLAGVRVK